MVKKCHKKSLKVYPYPYGIKKENLGKVKKLIDMNINGLFLNDPSVLKKITNI